MQIRQSLLS